jgi:hypothetical protein
MAKQEKPKVQKTTRRPRLKGSVKARKRTESQDYLSGIQSQSALLSLWELKRRKELLDNGCTDTIARNIVNREAMARIRGVR